MRDIISELVRKKQRLNSQKADIQREAKARCDEIDIELRKLDGAIDTINAVISDYLCPHCGGSGEERRCDAAGQMESVPCRKCGGTGVYHGG